MATETELQGPGNRTLKYIGLGFGIQNYTCSEEGADPVATGALAMLYDITPLYPGRGPQSLDRASFDRLGIDALYSHDVPLVMNSTATAGDDNVIRPGASTDGPFPPDAPLKLAGRHPIPFLGHHLFTDAGVPHFMVREIDFLASKNGAIDAPATADPGVDGTGAVTWLNLGATAESVGASLMYRVITAGGDPHGCSSAGRDSTPYTAQYWFYS